jgi:hypothetical protein
MWAAAARLHDPLTWAYATVRSRGLLVRIGGKPRVVLAPLIDLLNHGSACDGGANAQWEYDDAARALRVCTTRAVPRGAEVTLSYGRKSNADLLLHYGFVLPMPDTPSAGGGAGGAAAAASRAAAEAELCDALLELDFGACCPVAADDELGGGQRCGTHGTSANAHAATSLHATRHPSHATIQHLPRD